jgi:hypothetical protein
MIASIRCSSAGRDGFFSKPSSQHEGRLIARFSRRSAVGGRWIRVKDDSLEPAVDHPGGKLRRRLDEGRQLERDIERLGEQLESLAAFLPRQGAEVDAGQDREVERHEPECVTVPLRPVEALRDLAALLGGWHVEEVEAQFY